MKQSSQAGSVNPLLISNIITAIVVVILAGVSIWSYTNYLDQKNNTQEKISVAVKKAQDAQIKVDEAQFIEREKVPTRRFQGPADLGGVTFEYPKTWSVYMAKSASALEAYLYPEVVPTVASTQAFATRVLVEDKGYDEVIKSYASLVEKGDLRSEAKVVKGFSGIRLDGKFSKTREGSAVIFKVRDKTLTLATDSTNFRADFDNTILQSLQFNP